MIIESVFVSGVLSEQLDDPQDGTGVGARTFFDAKGHPTHIEKVEGLPVADELPADLLPSEIKAARALLLSATTVSQTKARTVALFDLLVQ